MINMLGSLFAIQEAEGLVETKREIIKAFADIGFDRICLSVNKELEAAYADEPDVSSIDEAVIKEYRSARMRECDFNLKRGIAYRTPFWFDVKSKRFETETKRFADFLASCDIHSGISYLCPSRRGLFSGVMLSRRRGAVYEDDILMRAGIITNAAVSKFGILQPTGTISADEFSSLEKLTAIQNEILNWAAEGKSNADIAVILNLSKAGIDYHIRAIVTKLGVFTKAQAIAIFSRHLGRRTVKL